MPKLLHVLSSPRGDDSTQAQLARAYIEEARQKDPALEVETIDLWRTDLPEFDGDKTAAKSTFFGVGQMDERLQTAWDQVVRVVEHFKAADRFVFSVPMWNGSVTYKLKHYIDLLSQPGLTFTFDPEKGYSGQLAGKSAHVFYTSGVFAPGMPESFGGDFQSTYLTWWLTFVGITDITECRFQPTALTQDPEGDRAAALERARALAS